MARRSDPAGDSQDLSDEETRGSIVKDPAGDGVFSGGGTWFSKVKELDTRSRRSTGMEAASFECVELALPLIRGRQELRGKKKRRVSRLAVRVLGKCDDWERNNEMIVKVKEEDRKKKPLWIQSDESGSVRE